MEKKSMDKRIALLKKHLSRPDVNIRDVAISIGVTDATIYNWLRGKGSVSRLASPQLDRFLRENTEEGHRVQP